MGRKSEDPIQDWYVRNCGFITLAGCVVGTALAFVATKLHRS